MDIPTGNNAWSAVLQQAEMRRRKRRQTTPEHPRRALFCLTLDNKLRRSCIKLVEWKYVIPKHIRTISLHSLFLLDRLNISFYLLSFAIVLH